MHYIDKCRAILEECEKFPDDCPAFLVSGEQYVTDAEEFYNFSRTKFPAALRAIIELAFFAELATTTFEQHIACNKCGRSAHWMSTFYRFLIEEIKKEFP